MGKGKAQARAAKEAKAHAMHGTTAIHASRLRVLSLTLAPSAVASTSAVLAHSAERD